MKRIGNVFETITSGENLWAAWHDFHRGKSGRRSVQAFEVDLEWHLRALRHELQRDAYRPGPYRLLLIQEPKRRLIAASSVRDRVVHHAVHRVVAPRLDRGLVEHTYACLPGRGSHRALLAFQGALRRYRWVLQLDIRHYFLSIDRDILMTLMEQRIKDRHALRLLRCIADSGARLYDPPDVRRLLGLEEAYPPPGRGLPIGNLTSQWWGNHYLSGLDHFIKRQLKIPHAQRYMDDTTLFADSRQQLEEAREALGEWLGAERRLRLKKPNAEIRSTRRQTLYLGHRVDRHGMRRSQKAMQRARRRLARHVVNGSPDELEQAAMSYRGVLIGPFTPRLDAVS